VRPTRSAAPLRPFNRRACRSRRWMKMTIASHSEHHCFFFLYLQRGGEATNKELGDLFASDAGATRAIILGQRIRQRHFGVNHKGVNRVVVRYVFPGASKVANKPQRLECLLTRGVLAASVYLKSFAAKPH